MTEYCAHGEPCFHQKDLDAAREMGRADIEPVLDKVAIPILEAKNAEIVRLKAKLDDSVTVKDHLEACDLARGQGRWEALRGALEACANLVSALSCCERLRELIAAEEKEDSITASADFIERNVGVCGIKPEFSRLKTALGGLQVGAREATDGVVAWQGEAMTAAPERKPFQSSLSSEASAMRKRVIWGCRKAGLTYKQIGDLFKMTPQSAQQFYQREVRRRQREWECSP